MARRGKTRIHTIELTEGPGGYGITFFHTDSPPEFIEGEDDFVGITLSKRAYITLLTEFDDRKLIVSQDKHENILITEVAL